MKLKKNFAYGIWVVMLFSLSQAAFAQDAEKITIPAGTRFKTLLQTPISSKLAELGDTVIMTLAEPIRLDATRVLPRGMEMTGKITYLKRSGRVKGRAEIYALINELNTHYGVESIVVSIDAADDVLNDEKIKTDAEGKMKSNSDAGGDVRKAVDGAILGSVVSTPIAIATQSAGAAAAGPAAGALAAILLTRGKEIRLPAGTLFRMKFDKPLTLPVSVTQQQTGR
jgi:type IV secretion system protein VirB10